MAISPSSIIHFTQKKEYLKGILESNFRLSCCKERFFFPNGRSIDLGIPMVSFCDIPLSQIKEHISKYGMYGIGLTKEWAIKNHLNPVLYLESESNLAHSFEKILGEYVIAKDLDSKDANDVERAVIDIFRYTKNYQADLNRENEVIKDYRFSDEREWRYVLELSETEKYICNHNECSEIDLSEHYLTFEPNDIQYVIIKDENEIHEFLDVFRNAKGNKYSFHDVERLMTRIITCKQIMNDF